MKQEKPVIRREFKVNCAAGDFFRWISQLSHYPEIFPHVIEIAEADTTVPLSVGKLYLEKAHDFQGREKVLKVRIRSYEPGVRLEAETDHPVLRTSFSFHVIAEGPANCIWIWEMYSSTANLVQVLLLKLLFLPRLWRAEKRLRGIFPGHSNL